MNIVRCCSSRIPAYPWLGWVGPPLHFHLGPGQVSGGTLSGSFPPQKNKLYVRVSLHTARIILRCPERHSFLVCWVGSRARANEHRPQQQETMTNGVRHLATSARKRNVVLVEAFFPLLVKGARDVRGVRAFRTTTGLVVLGRIPLLKGIGGRWPGLSYQKGCRKRTRPPISFDVPGQGPARFDRLLDNKKAS